MKPDHDYIQTSEKSSYGQEKDSCLRCGKSKQSHVHIEPGLLFRHQGRLYFFKNWKEAHKAGFYDGEDIHITQPPKSV